MQLKWHEQDQPGHSDALGRQDCKLQELNQLEIWLTECLVALRKRRCGSVLKARPEANPAGATKKQLPRKGELHLVEVVSELRC